MSVPKYRRNESPMQFLDTARELEIYTIQRCANFPKRYMFLITKELIDLSRSIYNNVKSANSVYPTNKEESQIRVNFLIQAVCDLQCLASQLDIAKGIVEHNDKDKAIKPTVWEQWARLISTELKLVVALKKSLQGKYNLEPKTE